jgi:hypothetical protein
LRGRRSLPLRRLGGTDLKFCPEASGFELKTMKKRLGSGLIFAGLILCLLSLAAANVRAPVGFVVDSPTITIAGATANTTSTPTTHAHEAQIQWAFGTVSGTYSTCTVQAKTTYDGTNYLTLGSAASVTVTTGTINAWTIIAQLGTTSVTTSAVSSTAALGFGQATMFTFACSSYGTSAPVTITVIYR